MADLLVDGHFLLHRVMRGSVDVRMLSTRSGKPSGGAFAFIKSLRSTLSFFSEVDRVIVVFDAGRSARRRELYPEYKAGRKHIEELDPDGWSYMDKLNAQVRILRQILPKLGVRVVLLPGREGDDILALIPRLTCSELTIVSTDDKDLLQLVSRSIHVWRPMAQEYITPTEFKEVIGCEQTRFLLWKAVIGDPSDNIIGVKGVGPKTMAALLERCSDVGAPPDFEKFFDFLYDLDDNKKAQKILDDEDRVLLNVELLDLSKEQFSEAEVEEVLAACSDPSKLNVLDARKLLEALEYFSLLEEFGQWVTRFQILR